MTFITDIATVLKEQFIVKKLNSLLGGILLFILAIVIAVIAGQFGMKGVIISLGGFLGLGMVVTALLNQYYGIYFVLTLGTFVTFFSKIVDLPFGTSLDLFLAVMSLGIFNETGLSKR